MTTDADKIKFRLDFEIAIREESLKDIDNRTDWSESVRRGVIREFSNELAILKKIRGDEDEV